MRVLILLARFFFSKQSTNQMIQILVSWMLHFFKWASNLISVEWYQNWAIIYSNFLFSSEMYCLHWQNSLCCTVRVLIKCHHSAFLDLFLGWVLAIKRLVEDKLPHLADGFLSARIFMQDSIRKSMWRWEFELLF